MTTGTDENPKLQLHQFAELHEAGILLDNWVRKGINRVELDRLQQICDRYSLRVSDLFFETEQRIEAQHDQKALEEAEIYHQQQGIQWPDGEQPSPHPRTQTEPQYSDPSQPQYLDGTPSEKLDL